MNRPLWYTEKNGTEERLMKKRICILLLAVALLMLTPHVASANAPAPDPWKLTVYLQNVPEGTTVTAFFAGEDGEYRQGETYTSDGAKNWKIGIRFAEDETQFYLTLVAQDGTETITGTAAIEPYGNYTFDGETNTLTAGKPKGTDTGLGDLAEACLACGAMVLLYVFAGLLMPIAVTFLVEWLTALCFKIRPVKYVFAINGITNPVMNLLLLIASSLLSFSRIAYWITLAVLEILVVIFEYWYYTRKYPETGRGKLLVFTITANVLSLGIGGLLQYLLL